LPETPDAQPSLFEGEPGETSPISRQNISGGIADTETAYQESLKNFSPSPRKSIHQLESESSRINFKEQDYDTMGGRTGATAYKETKGGVSDVKEAKGYQPWISEVVEPDSPENKVFDAVKGEDDKSIMPSNNKFYGKLDSTQKQNLETAGKVGGSFAQKVMMRESSGGVNTGDSTRAGSMFQFKQGGAYVGDQKIPEGVIGNPEKETKYFMDYNKQITKDFSEPKSSRKSSGGKSIYEIAKSHGVSQEGANYGAHQQGASGYKDIITAADSGNLSGGNKRILKMLNNVTPEQLKQLNSKYRKASGLTHQSLENSGEMKSFIQDWLSMQQESWDAMEGDFY
jgi:hypothetical protein